MADLWEVCLFDKLNSRLEYFSASGYKNYAAKDYWIKFIGTKEDWQTNKDKYSDMQGQAIVCKLLADGWEPYGVGSTEYGIVTGQALRRKVSS